MISPADLKLYIGAVDDGADAEAILTDLETWAVSIVQQATGRFFGASESHTYYLEGDGEQILYLPDDFTAVASVSERSTLASAWSALAATDYEMFGRELLRLDGGDWPVGRALVQATVTRGYSVGAEPGPIRQLVMDLVNWQYRAGRKLALDDLGSPDVGRVKGWDRVVSMYRGPLYG